MALYRQHRGMLEDSLKTTVIVKNEPELRAAIYEDWKMWKESFKKDGKPFCQYSFALKWEKYGEGIDLRCGWYTHLVSISFDGMEKFFPVGFLSEPFNG